jgi:hypothetical protein
MKGSGLNIWSMREAVRRLGAGNEHCRVAEPFEAEHA